MRQEIRSLQQMEQELKPVAENFAVLTQRIAEKE
jgi:hypothetical protein